MYRIIQNIVAVYFASWSLVTALPVYSQQLLFSMETQSSDPESDLTRIIQFQSSKTESIPIGLSVRLPLPDGRVVGGIVLSEHDGVPLSVATMVESTSTKSIVIEDGLGTVDIHLFESRIVGITIFQPEGNLFHRAILDSSARGILVDEDANNYLCVDMPVVDPGNRPQAEFQGTPDYSPPLAVVNNLQSRPSSQNVLYIDYWGGSITSSVDGFNVWNNIYGDPLAYDAYDIDNDTTNFSDTELYRMYHAWLETAEDYSAFDVNVTTQKSLYYATPIENRSRIIATTFDFRDRNNICISSCGGVAYRPSFGSSYFNIGFTFNNTIGSMGVTHSHEAGHQMGLQHDGTGVLDYYTGHENWGPIMGAPFDREYVQWSKGEYFGANNVEDDFGLIQGRLGLLSDDVGDVETQAESVDGSTDIIRSITPLGAVGSVQDDLDYFHFDLDASTTVEINVGPRFGLDIAESPVGETRGSNLAMNANLYKQGESVDILIMQSGDVVPLSPNTNTLTYSGSLDAGSYLIVVNGESPNPDWLTGFGEWGNGGEYRVSINYMSPQPPSVTGLISPSGPSTEPEPEFIWVPASRATEYRIFVADAQSSSGEYLSAWQSENSLNCNSDLCVFTPSQMFYGSKKWRVQARNINGKSAWSLATYFETISESPPAQVTNLISPTGAVESSPPIFTWISVSDVSEYRMSLVDIESGSTDILSNWSSSDVLGCAGAEICSFAPNVDILSRKKWRIQARNSAGKSAWSPAAYFSVGTTPPEPVTTLSPTGNVFDNLPEFSWPAAMFANEYRLQLKNKTTGELLINQWISAQSAECPSVADTCSYTSPFPLPTAQLRWWVQARNGEGKSAWSIKKDFTTP